MSTPKARGHPIDHGIDHGITAGPTPQEHAIEPRLGMLRTMLLIRHFEERVSKLYAAGEIPGFVHLSIGQEATAVGACWDLSRADVITSTHRGHAHCLAKGLDARPMFAELMGRQSGSNRGRGGSMHIADPTLGIFGANGDRGGRAPDRRRSCHGVEDQGRRVGRRRLLRRRRGRPRRVPRGRQPRRGLAAAGDLLLREQRVRRVLACERAARGVAPRAGGRLRRRPSALPTATTCSRSST